MENFTETIFLGLLLIHSLKTMETRTHGELLRSRVMSGRKM
jgi:hypothetical protein